ncbi:hypothetical protein HPB47_018312 [Ixodes persulcatus]|uniref:Uncharacterized protein n=1 Tax=Ixodes persulcatus TaxID=34615 RepID=A0AC60QN21_IXOPE|nr:hypothetical protein HPB47_018312 [Ixodes persulcatus]
MVDVIRFGCLLVFIVVISALAVKAQSPTGDCQAQPQSHFIGDRSSCTFTKLVDRDPGRIPSEIPTVSSSGEAAWLVDHSTKPRGGSRSQRRHWTGKQCEVDTRDHARISVCAASRSQRCNCTRKQCGVNT